MKIARSFMKFIGKSLVVLGHAALIAAAILVPLAFVVLIDEPWLITGLAVVALVLGWAVIRLGDTLTMLARRKALRTA